MFCIRKEDSISITKLTVFIKKKKWKKCKFSDRPGRKGEHTALLATMQLQLHKQLL